MVMKQVFASFIGGIATTCLALAVLHAQSRSDVPAQAHGYYLFLAQAPSGCEDCYIPLLVTQTRVEDLAREKRGVPSSDELKDLIARFRRSRQ